MTLNDQVVLFLKEKEALNEKFEAVFEKIKTRVLSDDDKRISNSVYVSYDLDDDYLTLKSMEWVGQGETEGYKVTIPIDELNDIDTWVTDYQQITGWGSNDEI